MSDVAEPPRGPYRAAPESWPPHDPSGQLPPGPPAIPLDVYAVTGSPLPALPVLPSGPSDYQQLLRGPAHRWWRPVISTLVLLAAVIVTTLGMVLALGVLGVLLGMRDPIAWLDRLFNGGAEQPNVFAVMNLAIILLIPSSIAALLLAHRAKIGYLASIAGRFRWAWFARCLAALAPLWVVYLTVGWLLEGQPTATRPRQWAVLVLLVLVMTPLQSAAEEVTFRGWFLQSIGSWFSNRWLALLVPMVLSVAAFAAAHGSIDPWILIDLGAFAVAATLMTWRTGGLEAAIALHLINNVMGMQASLFLGGFGEGFIDGSTTGTPAQAGISLLVQSLALTLVWRMAVRQRLTWRYQPAPPMPTGPPMSVQPWEPPENHSA